MYLKGIKKRPDQFKQIKIYHDISGCMIAEVTHSIKGSKTRQKRYVLKYDGFAEKQLMQFFKEGATIEFEWGVIEISKHYFIDKEFNKIMRWDNE